MTSTPEQREWQDKWIAALRSGKYSQAQNVLKNEDGAMCCLGVAKLIVQGENAFHAYDAAEGCHTDDLGSDPDVISAIGFKGYNGDFHRTIQHGEAEVYSFVNANDDADLNFEQIADLAEAHRDKVFV